jgi:hypothetical protein
MLEFIDFILNLAGLLLWLGWRSTHFDALARTSVQSLAGTLRRAEPQRWKGRQLLAALGALVLLRALFYWQIGAAVGWPAKLDLAVVVPIFRNDFLGPASLYSVLSLVRMLIVFYFWLLFLVLLNRKGSDTDPLLKMLRLHVGRASHWPWVVQLLLVPLVAASLWIILHPVFIHTGVTNRVSSNIHLLGQGMLVGGSVFLSLKYLIPVLLMLHWVASYVYLGASPFWDFVGATSRALIGPLRPRLLHAGKWDFAPLVGTGLALLLFYFLPNVLSFYLARYNLTLWPQ